MTRPRPFTPCTRYIDRMVRLPDGAAVTLALHQRGILEHVFTPREGWLPYVTVLWEEIKKSGKTALAAWIASWVLNTWGPRAEVLVAGNDFEQSVARVFAELVRVQHAHPALRRRITKVTERGLFLEDGSKALPVALDAAGEAGANPCAVFHDEAWGITTERARRLYDELTLPPTRPMAFRFISSYAGILGESRTLEELHMRGLAGVPVPGLPDCYANGSLFAFISHIPRMPWQLGPAGERYYAAQRAELRPAAFLRLHENRWVPGESIFLTAAMWDGCVVPDLAPPLPSHSIVLFSGADAGIKSDYGAVVTVYWRGDKLALGPFRIWRPTTREPLDLEATIEAYLRELHARYTVAAVLADPYQMHRSITTLRAAGVPITECPQTTANQTRAGQGLFDLLKGRNLELYADADLRQQALNAVAVESPRGWRLAKEKASKKIDAIVALSLAALAALDAPRPSIGDPRLVLVGGPLAVARERLLTVAGPAGVYGSWEERSAAAEAARSQGPGGAHRRGLVI